MVEVSSWARSGLLTYRHLVVLLSSSVAASSALAVTATPAWKSPTVLGAVNRLLQQGDRFLAYDNLGVPNIVSTDGASVSLYRQVPGLGWRSRVIATSFSGDASGVSIAINRREQPAISYGDTAGLHYVYWDQLGETFSDSLIDDSLISSRSYTGGTSIAFDLLGRPAIAAVDLSPSTDTVFVTDTNFDGILSIFDSLDVAMSFPDRRPSLAFDHNNRAMIVGNDGGFMDMAVKDPFIGWSQTTVVGGLGSSADPTSVTNGSVAIDPDDGLPAVAWTNQNTRELRYAKWSPFSNSWISEMVAVAPAGVHLSNQSLAFDPGDGHPAISYSDDLGQLFFAWHDGASWNSQFVVDTGGPHVPLRTSLDFNEYGHGFPAIAFIDGFGTVLFTVDPPLAAVPEPGAIALAVTMAMFSAGHRRRRPGPPAC